MDTQPPTPTVDDLLPKEISPPRTPQGMKKFTVYRRHDSSGVSGANRTVAQGVLLATGDVVVQWFTPAPDGDIQTKKSMKAFLDIHVTPHPENKTIITWEDGTQDFYPETKTATE